MDGARETSRPAAAMKTERPILRQLTWSPSLELLASLRFWTEGRRRLADDGVSMKHINCVFVKGGGGCRGSCGISATKRRKTRLHSRRARLRTSTSNGAGCSLDVAAGEYGRWVFEQQVLSSKSVVFP